MFWYMYRSHIAVSGLLLTLFLYAMLLTAQGMARPQFVLDQASASAIHVNSRPWRAASDFLAGRKYMVLTFDDGPYDYGLDGQILTILRKHHAHAVFFLVCSHINDADRDVLAKFEREGDLIGNQGYDHLKLNTLARPALEQQIGGCSKRLAELSGHRPYYFRPPFGATSPLVAQVAQSYGMKQMLWNANSQDSWMTGREQILQWSVEQPEDQSILLLHEKPTTVAVLDEALTRLEERGFQFVLPDQLSNNSAIN
jgi:peptidoglycan-N-acetylglucosamine deacetylase